MEAVIEGLQGYSEHRGRRALVAAAMLECDADQVALDITNRSPDPQAVARMIGEGDVELIRCRHNTVCAVGDHVSVMDHVPQFTDVTGPSVCQEPLECCTVENLVRAVTFVQVVEERLRKQ